MTTHSSKSKKKKRMQSLKHRIEYIVLVLVSGLARVLPLRAALALGWIAAAFVFLTNREKRERTDRRIREVYGDRYTKKEIRHIGWIAWRNICFNAVEALRFVSLTPEKMRKQPLIKLEPELKKIINERTEGFILATPHMGNWEIAGVAADLLGVPLFVIVRKQKNVLIDAYINRMRQTFSMEVLHRETQMWKGVIDRIKEGKVLAILPDVYARTKGVTVDFLNGKASIPTGTARFAQAADCPIYPICVRRIGWTQHDATLLGPVFPDPLADKEADQQRIMQEVMSAFSKEIDKAPEQYFWHNKRWVLHPSRKNPAKLEQPIESTADDLDTAEKN